MDNLLKELTTGFSSERFNSLEEVSARTQKLNEYIKSLDAVLAKIKVVADEHNKDISSLQKEKAKLESEISGLKKTYKETIDFHDSKLKDKFSVSSSLDKDISNKEERVFTLDRKANGLITEIKHLELSSETLRLENANLDRQNKEMAREEKRLTDSITKLKEQEAEVINSIEAERKQLSNLKSEIAVIESRK